MSPPPPEHLSDPERHFWSTGLKGVPLRIVPSMLRRAAYDEEATVVARGREKDIRVKALPILLDLFDRWFERGPYLEMGTDTGGITPSGKLVYELLKQKPNLTRIVDKSEGALDFVITAYTSDRKGAFERTELDLGNGWKWVQVCGLAQGHEGQRMQHCGRVGDYGATMYSLRDENDEPHVTIAFWTNSEGTVGISDLRGFQDKKPDPKYNDAIDAMIKHMGSQR